MRNILWTAALIMLAACSRGTDRQAPGVERTGAPVAEASTTAEVPAESGALKLVSADGSRSITVSIEGQRVEVSTTGGAHFIGEAQGGKRRYRDTATGGAFVEVKSGDNNSFKVRTPEGRLLWKVKFDAGKVKVSDNEENRDPWILKTKYDGKAKVLDPAGKEIGDVTYHQASGKSKVKDEAGNEVYSSRSGRMTPAFGVTLMSGVPERHRLIVMAELIARGI